MFVSGTSTVWPPSIKEVVEPFVFVTNMFGKHSVDLLAVLKLALEIEFFFCKNSSFTDNVIQCPQPARARPPLNYAIHKPIMFFDMHNAQRHL